MVLRTHEIETRIEELRSTLIKEKARLEKYIREHPIIRTKKEQMALEDLNTFLRGFNRLPFEILNQ